ncbi:hypothetical protein J2R99_000441 [Rhodopseudomonas julia]|uniref:Uncharacterized protein n=1 Tax=Rhodopseudomonas julia TaxID=200617 RepID=A0ABU0C683_9BRAD|nr:hypothetical protein [Rhodopseudomonas julia]
MRQVSQTGLQRSLPQYGRELLVNRGEQQFRTSHPDIGRP